MQLVSGLVDRGLDPQAALDAPRFRVEGDGLFLEEGLWDRAAELEGRGYRVVRDRDTVSFGGGQAILRAGTGLVGGSDPRKDGYAGAFR
jgi:gamma-glutamyltranspeptidase/glutathione hydrolase